MIDFLAIFLKVIVADIVLFIVAVCYLLSHLNNGTIHLIGRIIGRIARFFQFGPFPRRRFDLGRPTGW